MPKKSKQRGSKLPRGAQKGRRAMTEMKRRSRPAPVAADVEEQKTVLTEAPAAVENAPAPVRRKKPGRKPMTEEQKAEARKLREEKKAAAEGITTVYLQYKGREANVAELIEAAKADYKASHKRTPVTGVKLYLKPEEYTAYYVINESGFGKVGM